MSAGAIEKAYASDAFGMDRLALLVMSDQAATSGMVAVSQRELARMMGVSKTYASDIITRLENQGYLRVKSVGGGRGSPSVYQLTPATGKRAAEPKAEPQRCTKTVDIEEYRPLVPNLPSQLVNTVAESGLAMVRAVAPTETKHTNQGKSGLGATQDSTEKNDEEFVYAPRTPHTLVGRILTNAGIDVSVQDSLYWCKAGHVQDANRLLTRFSGDESALQAAVVDLSNRDTIPAQMRRLTALEPLLASRGALRRS